MSGARFSAISLLVAAFVFAVAWWIGNGYVFFAGYLVLQYVVLATAWNMI